MTTTRTTTARRIVAVVLAAGLLFVAACGINADDRPRPIAPKDTTTTTR